MGGQVGQSPCAGIVTADRLGGGERLAQRLIAQLRREMGGEGGQSPCAVIVTADRLGGGERQVESSR